MLVNSMYVFFSSAKMPTRLPECSFFQLEFFLLDDGDGDGDTTNNTTTSLTMKTIQVLNCKQTASQVNRQMREISYLFFLFTSDDGMAINTIFQFTMLFLLLSFPFEFVLALFMNWWISGCSMEWRFSTVNNLNFGTHHTCCTSMHIRLHVEKESGKINAMIEVCFPRIFMHFWFCFFFLHLQRAFNENVIFVFVIQIFCFLIRNTIRISHWA